MFKSGISKEKYLMKNITGIPNGINWQRQRSRQKFQMRENVDQNNSK